MPTSDSLDALVRRLHDHLETTESLPVDYRANRWLGEATAIAADLRRNDVRPATVYRRVEHVRTLLDRMGDVGCDEAADHVEAARAVTEEILADR